VREILTSHSSSYSNFLIFHAFWGIRSVASDKTLGIELLASKPFIGQANGFPLETFIFGFRPTSEHTVKIPHDLFYAMKTILSVTVHPTA
jgi:hypothetical protein